MLLFRINISENGVSCPHVKEEIQEVVPES